jgi:ABC-type Zn uptake system ZnuABC Zn-binding protein ZnuA
MMRTRRLAALAVVLTAALTAGCRRAAPTAVPARPVVVATIFPLAAIARQLVGDAADVTTLLPAGASPHTFELTPDSARRIARASLVLRIGPGADEWLDAALTGGHSPVFTAMEHTKLIAGDPEADEHPNLKLDNDPHCWLDPLRMRDDLAPAMAEALGTALPQLQASLPAALKQLQADLTSLDAKLRATLAGLTDRRYIGAHPAWRYFDQRYELDCVATVEPVGGTEPSAQWLKQVVEIAKRDKVRCVFTEVQLSDKLVRAVAGECGAKVGVLDEVGGEGVAGRDSYDALLAFDAQQLAEGLK